MKTESKPLAGTGCAVVLLVMFGLPLSFAVANKIAEAFNLGVIGTVLIWLSGLMCLAKAASINRREWQARKAKASEILRAEQAVAHRAQAEAAFPHIVALEKSIPTRFDCAPCPRCAELKMVVLQMTPNGRSIEVRCSHCQHSFRWKAVHPDTSEVVKSYRCLKEALAGTPYFLPVSVPPAKYSADGGREPIPTGVKEVVWRRDGGRCVQCGAEVNLHFDHIIPVSKGGATTIENLQILCAPCNLSKGAKI